MKRKILEKSRSVRFSSPIPKSATSDPLFEELWELFARGEHWSLAEGQRTRFPIYATAGTAWPFYPTTIPGCARPRGPSIDSLFEKIFISSEMGVEKPDLRIFRKWKKPSVRSPRTSCTSETATLGISKGPGKPDGMPCCSANPSLRKPNHRLSPTDRMVAMSGSRQADLHRRAPQLGSMPPCHWAEPDGGYLAYLDFTDVFEPDRQQVEETFKPFPQRAGRQAELPGMDWFLRVRISRRPPRALFRRIGTFPFPTVGSDARKRLSVFFPMQPVESRFPGGDAKSPTYLRKKHSLPPHRARAKPSIACNLEFGQYEEVFRQAREAILDGETYQIKISQRFEAPARIDRSGFERLCLANPAPEAFLLWTENFSILSCSPETVIERKEDRITTRPIGGTYQRKTGSSDGSVIESFLNDPKEVAEHNMLVDLERNDLSAICKPGTVAIERFREVESYAHLHHLVSTIGGNLKKESISPHCSSPCYRAGA